MAVAGEGEAGAGEGAVGCGGGGDLGVVVPLSCSERAAANPPAFGASLVGLFEPEPDESAMGGGAGDGTELGCTLVPPPHPARSPRITRNERVAGVRKRILSWSPALRLGASPVVSHSASSGWPGYR